MAYGIWSDFGGGFIETQLFSVDAGEERILELVAQGESEDDLEVAEECDYHDEQRADECEDCAEDEDEDD